MRWNRECGISREALQSALAILGLCAAAGCSAPLYPGLSLHAGGASSALQEIARRARGGDKQAQLELAIHYEEGRGVPRDAAQAARLYRSASADVGGPIQLYVHPVGAERAGRIITVQRGPRLVGLAEAKARLARLQQAERSGR
uniref:SEL1-like repeat protein n=1 Tax=uncultured Sphingomonas sp. TaxID=158754 RepID=UPI0035CB07DD